MVTVKKIDVFDYAGEIFKVTRGILLTSEV